MPIIATCREGTEIASVVTQCGMVVPPEDGAALANAIEQLVDNDEERLQMGLQARIYSEDNLARDSVLGRLLEQFTVTTITPKLDKQGMRVVINGFYKKFVANGQRKRLLKEKTKSLGQNIDICDMVEIG
jgi:hypothetical protein